MIENSVICAISSPAGAGAIAILRLSGKGSIKVLYTLCKNSRKVIDVKEKEMVYTGIYNDKNELIDNVLICKYKAPESFTGEDMVEIFCHGSEYIQKQILDLCCDMGAEIAKPGEFTQRAFFNGKFDLSQSEAIADLIASKSKEDHRIAINQMKGTVSTEINNLRTKLIELVSLIELELDFGEEDVEFADRNHLSQIVDNLIIRINQLNNSFKYGNAIKNGVPVVIVGKPNVGKSSLLNVLLQEEKAIVSDIPGTTRDIIEDEINIEGIRFRFIDTAGLRNSEDTIEKIGIDRAHDRISKALIIMLIFDIDDTHESMQEMINQVNKRAAKESKIIVIRNKTDLIRNSEIDSISSDFEYIPISVKTNSNIDLLKIELLSIVKSFKAENTDIIISNVRHEQALKKASKSLSLVKKALNENISGDFISQDIREALYYLGEITGSISNEEVLGAIFQKFCIGK